MNNKKVILCFHGFKTGDYHDFSFFEEHLKNNPTLFSGEIKLISLYDIKDKKSYKNKLWGKIALNETKKYIDDGYTVYLVGYSVGAVIASYVASKCKIEKLILLAPAFRLIGGKLITNNIKYLFKYLRLRLFHNDVLKRFKKSKKKVVPLSLIFNILGSIMRYRKSIKKVKAETLIMLGLQDKYIPMNAANYAFINLRQCKNKQLWLVDNVNHLFIFASSLATQIITKILFYINGQSIVDIY